MLNVVIVVNKNSFNESSLNNNENNIVFQLMKSAIQNNYNVVASIIPNKKLAVNEIIPYIYANTQEKFDGLYFVNKSNIASTNDDVSRFVFLADNMNIQIITEKEGNLSEEFNSNKKAILEKQAEKRASTSFETKIKINNQGFYTGGKTPFGYNVTLEGRFEINEDEAIIIKEIFELYKRGLRAVNISRYIGDIYKLKYKGDNSYWKSDRIFGYLSNPIYNGYPTTNRTTKNEKGNTVNLPRCEWKISPVAFEEYKIIDDETFKAVQERLWKEDKDRPLDYRLEWEEKIS